jgi:hypothetical protein
MKSNSVQFFQGNPVETRVEGKWYSSYIIYIYNTDNKAVLIIVALGEW